jgi:hypothetical protein
MGHKNSKEVKTKIAIDQLNKHDFNDLLDKNETKREIIDLNNECLVKSCSNLTLNINDLDTDDDEKLDNFSLSQENLFHLNSYDSDDFSFDQEVQNTRSIGDSKYKIYKPNKINLLYNQNIEDIRSKKKLFTDSAFKTSIKSLINETKSDFAKSLFEIFKCYHNNLNLNELNRKIKWKRSQVNFILFKFFLRVYLIK